MNKKVLKDILQYEKDYANKKIMKTIIKDKAINTSNGSKFYWKNEI